jgi:phosphoribosyl-dephospho-CoA transferase
MRFEPDPNEDTTMQIQRHRLVRLHTAGWADVLARQWDDEARACLAHWQEHDLPLVITRQPKADDDQGHDVLALGLPAPERWSRRRLGLQVSRAQVRGWSEFPRAAQVAKFLHESARREWQHLCRNLAALDVPARVYGSHGWQWLTGLRYLHAGSDLDLLLPVQRVAQADAVSALLSAGEGQPPRLDGELMFGDGSAVAWREWLRWRAGRTPQVIVKRIDASFLARSIEPFADAERRCAILEAA